MEASIGVDTGGAILTGIGLAYVKVLVAVLARPSIEAVTGVASIL